MGAKKTNIVVKKLRDIFLNINMLFLASTLVLYFLILYYAYRVDLLLGRSEIITGYSLLFVIFF